MTSQIIDPHFENDDLQPPENRLLKFFYNASKVISVNVVVRHVIFVAVVALVVSSAVLDVVRVTLQFGVFSFISQRCPSVRDLLRTLQS